MSSSRAAQKQKQKQKQPQSSSSYGAVSSRAEPQPAAGPSTSSSSETAPLLSSRTMSPAVLTSESKGSHSAAASFKSRGTSGQLGDTESVKAASSHEEPTTTVLHSGPIFTDADEPGFSSALPESRRTIGIVSATFLIINRMIGAGVFATPSSILRATGSVGLSLICWAIGSIIAAAGLAVYIEWGVGVPVNGAEKAYLSFLERAYRAPKWSAMCAYAAYACLLGWPAGNALVFGTYILRAAQYDASEWASKGIGAAVLTFCFLIHSFALKWGLHLQNILGTFKVFILVFIACSGFAALAGHTRLAEQPRNFSNAFEGSTADAYGIVSALYSVIWSFIGFSNVNYSLSEVEDPRRTLAVAAPLALVIVGTLYMLVNIAYFAAIPKADILNSQQAVAAIFFENMFGAPAQRALSVIVALSALGNVLSVLFAQGRIVQALGWDGVLPASRAFGSNWPRGAPFAGLGLHWLVSMIILLAPPLGDAYNFILNVVSYPLNIVNLVISVGLLSLYFHTPAGLRAPWSPSFRATWPVVAFFALASLFLVVAPFIPPSQGNSVYASLPYYLHCIVGIGVFVAGALYWVVVFRVLPAVRGYEFKARKTTLADGTEITVLDKVPRE
ncbi:methionine permease [Tilletia horrida]|uniref:Methionine permease n=1 Tax=Tilletia horrida TaxID=155126 RepID=A0AAN6JM52_9BASI|nr:methionine permease [Tilletia horrida]